MSPHQTYFELTDTIGTSGTLVVTSDTPLTDVLRWYSMPGDGMHTETMKTLIDSLGVFGPSYDREAADYLGIRVEALCQQ